jgi:guanylate kinase
MIKKDELLEWAIVYGNYYGSSKKTVLRLLKKNKPVILRIDPQGARTIKKMFKEAKVIFIVPPSIKILEKRLKKRGLDSNEVIKQRLIKAKEELTNLKQWDYVVENKENKLKETIKKVKKIILKEFQK